MHQAGRQATHKKNKPHWFRILRGLRELVAAGGGRQKGHGRISRQATKTLTVSFYSGEEKHWWKWNVLRQFYSTQKRGNFFLKRERHTIKMERQQWCFLRSYTFAFRSVFCPQAAKKYFFMSGNEFERRQVTLIVAIVETPRLNVRKQLVREMFLLRSVANLFPKIEDPFVMMTFLSLPEFRVSISLSHFFYVFLPLSFLSFLANLFFPLSFSSTFIPSDSFCRVCSSSPHGIDAAAVYDIATR